MRKTVGSKYPFAWWLNASSDEILAGELERFRNPNVENNANLNTAAELLHNILQNLAPSIQGLIVLDGVPNVGGLGPVIDATGACDVLITTTSSWPQSVAIGSLNPEPSVISFIAEHAGITLSEALALFRCVTGLPLGIHHACDYIARTRITVSEYAGRLEENPDLWIDASLTPADFRDGLLRAAGISIKMSQDDPTISRALAIIGVSASSPFPVALLSRIMGHEVNEVLDRLVSSFSVELDAQRQSIFLHEIVRRAIRAFYSSNDLDRARQHLKIGLYSVVSELQSDSKDATTAMLLVPHVLALKASTQNSITAISLAEICHSQSITVEELWLYAYNALRNADSQEGNSRDINQEIRRLRAYAVARLGSLYKARGRLSHGLAIVQAELDIANAAGDVGARSELLHILGHLIDELYGVPEKTVQIFRQAQSALEICGGSPEELALILTCSAAARLGAASQNADSYLPAACKDLSIAATDISKALQILEDKWNESGQTSPQLSKRSETVQQLIFQKHKRLPCTCDIEAIPEPPKVSIPLEDQAPYDSIPNGRDDSATVSAREKQFNSLLKIATVAAQVKDFRTVSESFIKGN